uniref:Uncharacterized protein n=1 Tax=Panagrolaimus superbus TaxID=310955 RepID=A0A914YDN7_9BILA
MVKILKILKMKKKKQELEISEEAVNLRMFGLEKPSDDKNVSGSSDNASSQNHSKSNDSSDVLNEAFCSAKNKDIDPAIFLKDCQFGDGDNNDNDEEDEEGADDDDENDKDILDAALDSLDHYSFLDNENDEIEIEFDEPQQFNFSDYDDEGNLKPSKEDPKEGETLSPVLKPSTSTDPLLGENDKTFLNESDL